MTVEKNRLLDLRKKAKARQPGFIRHKVHTKPRLAEKWRKPTGLKNKMRLGLKSYGKKVSPGYGSPAEIKHLNSEGLEKVLVNNVSDLKKIDLKSQGIVISSKVGTKKRIAIVKAAFESKIQVLSIKDAETFLKNAEKKFSEKNSKKKESLKAKKEKTAEKEKVAPKKEEPAKTEEEKKKEENKEKEKILTKRGE